MKAVWRGNISFALLSIPVKAYSATHPRGLGFHLLHKKCSTPLSYERHCPTCNIAVRWEDVVHGYEYEKGRFVTLTDEEIESFLKQKRSIEVIKFIDKDSIEPIYYNRPYFLEPEEGAEKAYLLLRELLRQEGKVALSKAVIKEREHIAVIRQYQDALLLHTLLYAEEVAKLEGLNIPVDIKLNKKEIALGVELLKRFIGGFDIETYEDEFRHSIMQLIRAKIEGKEIKILPVKEAKKVVSLMDALKKSLKERPLKKTRKLA